jgi:peptidyl-prolyl cis-trans isomerase A (cyclophilin A)
VAVNAIQNGAKKLRTIKITVLLSLLCLFNSATFAYTKGLSTQNSHIKITTDLGEFRAVLYNQKAPITVANFLGYISSDFYAGTIFHRVIPDFVLQGGGYTVDFKKKSTRASIKNESNNGLSNVTGTLAMARLPAPNTATTQFYINLIDNSHLDAQRGSAGYTVFGKVVAGMNTIEKIAREPTGQFKHQAPNSPVRILSIEVINSL